MNKNGLRHRNTEGTVGATQRPSSNSAKSVVMFFIEKRIGLKH